MLIGPASVTIRMTSLYMDEVFLDRMGGIAGFIRDSISWGIETVFAFTIWLIAVLGYPGIVIAMAIESACIPLPSELIMPLAGYEVSDGRMNVPFIDNNFVDLFAVSVAGALGCVIGSVAAYWAGYKGGRPFVEKQGRYILISKRDIELMDKIFHRYGMITVFLTRMMPVVRTFISLPAGISRMPFKRFVTYTFVGSLPWCFLLAWIGYILGKNWEKVGDWFHRIDIVIVALGIAAVIAFLIYKRHEIVVWFNLVFLRKEIE
jgi:membrane protein DedA with SNARE-associated domain